MARDYAKRPNRSNASNRGSGKLWLVTLVLMGLFAAGIFYLKQQGNRLAKQEAPKEETAKTATKNHKAEHAATTAKEQTPSQAQQKFDFYTMLPKVQVPAPKDDEKQTSTANQASSAKTTTSPEQASQQTAAPAGFVLQLGVFKNFASADELKAQIVLQGFEANTTQIKRGDTMLYRVWIGPYKTRADAQKQQKNLEANQIKSTLVKAQP